MRGGEKTVCFVLSGGVVPKVLLAKTSERANLQPRESIASGTASFDAGRAAFAGGTRRMYREIRSRVEHGKDAGR